MHFITLACHLLCLGLSHGVVNIYILPAADVCRPHLHTPAHMHMKHCRTHVKINSENSYRVIQARNVASGYPSNKREVSTQHKRHELLLVRRQVSGRTQRCLSHQYDQGKEDMFIITHCLLKQPNACKCTVRATQLTSTQVSDIKGTNTVVVQHTVEENPRVSNAAFTVSRCHFGSKLLASIFRFDRNAWRTNIVKSRSFCTAGRSADGSSWKDTTAPWTLGTGKKQERSILK